MYKGNDPCLVKAYDDEPIFVLLARDLHAPATILHWAGLSILGQPKAKIQEAVSWAIKMNETRMSIMAKIDLDKQITGLVNRKNEITHPGMEASFDDREDYPVQAQVKKAMTKPKTPRPRDNYNDITPMELVSFSKSLLGAFGVAASLEEIERIAFSIADKQNL